MVVVLFIQIMFQEQIDIFLLEELNIYVLIYCFQSDSSRGVYWKKYSVDVQADTALLTQISNEVNTQFGNPATGTPFAGKVMIVATWNKMGLASGQSQVTP